MKLQNLSRIISGPELFNCSTIKQGENKQKKKQTHWHWNCYLRDRKRQIQWSQRFFQLLTYWSLCCCKLESGPLPREVLQVLVALSLRLQLKASMKGSNGIFYLFNTSLLIHFDLQHPGSGNLLLLNKLGAAQIQSLCHSHRDYF